MVRNILLTISIAVVLLAASCAGRKNKVTHKNIIPEKDLVSILTEVHLADGLLSIPQINYMYSDRDTLSPYIDIIQKHGYTKADMDRTIRYYFIKRPKKLIRIYDKALGALSEMEARVDKEMPALMSGELNLWQGKSYYSLPFSSGKDTTWFEFLIYYPGVYSLQYTLTMYPDDQTLNPHPDIFYCPSDSVEYAKRKYLSVPPYIKDGQPHKYNAVLTLNKTGSVWLMGWFIDHETQSPSLEKHYTINDISLKRGLTE